MTTRTVLVTGSSSGIGRATVEGFLDQEWRVYATARDTDDVADLGERTGCVTARLDVTEETDVEGVVARMVDEEGRIDCLVNNAGYGQFGPTEDVPVERVHRQFDVNVYGPHRLTVVVVDPGPVATNFADRADAEVAGVERSGAYESFYAAFADASLFGDDGPATIPPERVAADVVNAASATKPRARYPVGTPARVGVLARFVPDRLRDRAFALVDRLS